VGHSEPLIAEHHWALAEAFHLLVSFVVLIKKIRQLVFLLGQQRILSKIGTCFDAFAFLVFYCAEFGHFVLSDCYPYVQHQPAIWMIYVSSQWLTDAREAYIVQSENSFHYLWEE